MAGDADEQGIYSQLRVSNKLRSQTCRIDHRLFGGEVRGKVPVLLPEGIADRLISGHRLAYRPGRVPHLLIEFPAHSGQLP